MRNNGFYRREPTGRSLDINTDMALAGGRKQPRNGYAKTWRHRKVQKERMGESPLTKR